VRSNLIRVLHRHDGYESGARHASRATGRWNGTVGQSFQSRSRE
jgi:hypothetical protein